VTPSARSAARATGWTPTPDPELQRLTAPGAAVGLVSCSNLCDMVDAGVEFIAPASKSYVGAAELARFDLDAAVEVDYVAARDENKPASERGRWRVFEDTATISGRRKQDPKLVLRWVFVHSSARAGAAVTARARKLDRARDDLERLGRGLGRGTIRMRRR
jgi:hypothetical protein